MILWCHVRHINLTQDHPGRLGSNLNYEGIEFPLQEKRFYQD